MNLALRLACPALLLAGCTIYTPLHPPAPAIQHQHEAEISGGLRLTGHGEGAVTYAPLPHLLLRAAGGGTLRPDQPDDTVRYSTRQWEGAVGTYWAVGGHWLLGGLVGYGQGRGSHWYSRHSAGIISFQPDSVWSYRYEARYRRSFAEAYAHWLSSPRLALGGAFRLSQVRFSELTNAGRPTGFRRMWRHEPQLFLRLGGLDNQPGSWIAGQLTLGSSYTPGFVAPSGRAGNRDAVEPQLGGFYTTFSVILRPHYLWARYLGR